MEYCESDFSIAGFGSLQLTLKPALWLSHVDSVLCYTRLCSMVCGGVKGTASADNNTAVMHSTFWITVLCHWSWHGGQNVALWRPSLSLFHLLHDQCSMAVATTPVPQAMGHIPSSLDYYRLCERSFTDYVTYLGKTLSCAVDPSAAGLVISQAPWAITDSWAFFPDYFAYLETTLLVTLWIPAPQALDCIQSYYWLTWVFLCWPCNLHGEPFP